MVSITFLEARQKVPPSRQRIVEGIYPSPECLGRIEFNVKERKVSPSNSKEYLGCIARVECKIAVNGMLCHIG